MPLGRDQPHDNANEPIQVQIALLLVYHYPPVLLLASLHR